MISSRKEIRDHILTATRQADSQIGTFINNAINQTISEINDPAWASPRGGQNHLWSFLRRKTTFSTTSSTTDYVLPRDVDRIALVRQTTSPSKIYQIADEQFFKLVPNPTDTGNPLFYRLWEVEGVATRLAVADTIDVVSSSTSDAGSAELALSVWGYVGGIFQNETYTLNGTTTVSGSKTFQAREIYVSKQKDTTGTITVTENSGGTTLVTLGPSERNPRFRVISLYPIPSSALTIYLEYYTRMNHLTADSDTPPFDRKWHYVVVLGTLSKVYQYLNKENDFATTFTVYKNAVWSMVSADSVNYDLVEYLEPSQQNIPNIRIRRSTDAVA